MPYQTFQRHLSPVFLLRGDAKLVFKRILEKLLRERALTSTYFRGALLIFSNKPMQQEHNGLSEYHSFLSDHSSVTNSARKDNMPLK